MNWIDPNDIAQIPGGQIQEQLKKREKKAKARENGEDVMLFEGNNYEINSQFVENQPIQVQPKINVRLKY